MADSILKLSEMEQVLKKAKSNLKAETPDLNDITDSIIFILGISKRKIHWKNI